MMKHTLFLLILLPAMAVSQSSYMVNLLDNWNDTTLDTNTNHYIYNDVWGFEQNGREYAVIGSTFGTHVLDVTNPTNVVVADEVMGTNPFFDEVTHRDFKTYNGYLYAVSDNSPSSLQIMDLSYLPDSVHVVYDSDTLIDRAHNIFIDTATAKLYACGGNQGNNFSIFDISTPTNPLLITQCSPDIFWWNYVIPPDGYVHDMYVKNDTAWCHARNGMFVFDFTDMANPILLGSLTSYPHQGYNHSGWMKNDNLTYAMTDETYGKKIKIVDISDITDMRVIDTLGPVNYNSASVPHNVFFHHDYLYASHYQDGFYMWNMQDPHNPVLAGYYDTYSGLDSMRGAWGVYPFLPSGNVLVSDMYGGLFVFDVSNATSIQEHENETRFTAYPNPFHSEINLMNLSHAGETYQATLIDLGGKTHFQTQLNNLHLGKNRLKIPEYIRPGFYFLTLRSSSFSQTIKLVKE